MKGFENFPELYIHVLSLPYPDKSSLENNVDPDQLASEKPADQDTHFSIGEHWLSGRVLDARSNGCRFPRFVSKKKS